MKRLFIGITKDNMLTEREQSQININTLAIVHTIIIFVRFVSQPHNKMLVHTLVTLSMLPMSLMHYRHT